MIHLIINRHLDSLNYVEFGRHKNIEGIIKAMKL